MMGIAVELENLTTAEKIGIMESLWEDLCRNASDTLSPSWHGDVLAQREGAVTVGEACFVDWNEAKKKIRESL
jgi:hypothetical protein